METNKEKPKKEVLMIYTGGTIGMLHKDNDPTCPLSPASWNEIKKHSPHFLAFDKLNFDVKVDEMDHIDSSDMNPEYWLKIARKIRDNYDKYVGFVILHGTDTMTYTATALSFLFVHLSKPVIITGSQLPLVEARSDAAQNLVTALIIAASDGVPTIPEVCVLFNNILLRGNRTRKVSSTEFAAFDSPNFPPLAKIGEHIHVNKKIIRKIPSYGFFINESMDDNIMTIKIFPGIKPERLNNVFSDKELKGVVLLTFGAGNTSENPDFLRVIECAIKEKGLTIVNITQCNQGMVEMGLYNASSRLLQLGVISGVDMTPEAAECKMMFLLGQGYDTDTVKKQMQKDICGEQNYNVFNLIYERGSTSDNCLSLKSQRLPAGYLRDQIATASVHFDGIKAKGKETSLKLALFVNYPFAKIDTDTTITQCLGVIEKELSDEKRNDYTLLCTEKVRQVIADHDPVQLSVVSKNGDIEWENVSLTVYTNVSV
jgi:L-asparaginase